MVDVSSRISPSSGPRLRKLDQAAAERVMKKLRWLADNSDSVKPEPLTGPFADFFKLRVGDYRVLYQADREKQLLTVRLIGHRREIYERPT